MYFNQKMKYLREKKGLTQEEAAQQIGVSVSSIKNYEKNRVADTSTLRFIASFYDVPYEFLLDDDCINEDKNNISIGKTLKLTDASLDKIKQIHLVSKNNIFNDFIKKTSPQSFWKMLDKYSTVSKERKQLNDLKSVIDSIAFINNYSTLEAWEHYGTIEEEIFLKIDTLSFYKNNTTNYDCNEKKQILNVLQCIREHPVINEKYDDVFDLAYPFIDAIEKCIENNSLIPKDDLKSLFTFINRKINSKNEESEKLRSSIIKEFSKYLNMYK